MLLRILKGSRGFTLIELLAVMGIVGVLAAIVTTSVSGSGETSRDTQTQQDATTVNSSAADFFNDQTGAEVLVPKTVTVLGVADITQQTSSRWPEQYIATTYADVFPPDNTSTVASLFILRRDGTLRHLPVRRLLSNFNAIDFSKLEDGGYISQAPDAATSKSGIYNNYLWFLEKTTAAGGSGEDSSRSIAILKLVSVDEQEDSGLVDLIYQPLVKDAGPNPPNLVNPSFESGDLTGWNTQIPTGGFVSPTTIGADMNAKHGDFFAFLKTNGPGSYTSLFQPVSVSAGQTISGWAFFHDAETASGFDGCFYNDNAQVHIRSGEGIGGPILATVFSASTKCANTGFPGTVPWTPFSYTFTSSGTFTVEARITNSRDSAVDSHFGLDGLAIE